MKIRNRLVHVTAKGSCKRVIVVGRRSWLKITGTRTSGGSGTNAEHSLLRKSGNFIFDDDDDGDDDDDDDDDDDEIAYFTVRWKTRASFVYRSKNMK